ncbi:MAG TPA: hypothetical protein VGJ95_14745 [Pseudonocardiaceae bacterium]|jgi:hypothetical protein
MRANKEQFWLWMAVSSAGWAGSPIPAEWLAELYGLDQAAWDEAGQSPVHRAISTRPRVRRRWRPRWRQMPRTAGV